MPQTESRTEWVPMCVIGVRRPRPTNPPMLVLGELEGTGIFQAPLVPDQAHLLAHELRGDATPYSLTGELIEQLLSWLDARVTAITLAGGEGPDDVVAIEVLRGHERRVLRAGTAEGALLSQRLGVSVSVAAELVRGGSRDGM